MPKTEIPSDVINPANGTIIATVPRATVSDVETCVSASRAAFKDKSWKNMDPAQRGRILNKMAAATYGAAKELAKIESENNGKTFREALSEIRYGAWTLEYFAGLSDKIEGSTIPVPGNRLNYTLRQPLGVTAHIVPLELPSSISNSFDCPSISCGLYCNCQASVLDSPFINCLGGENGSGRSWFTYRSSSSDNRFRWIDWRCFSRTFRC